MTDTDWTHMRRIAVSLILLLFAVSIIGLVSGGSSIQESGDGVSIEHNGTHLDVTVNATQNETFDTLSIVNITVKADGNEEVFNTSQPVDRNPFEFSINLIEDLDVTDQDLSDATVQLDVTGETANGNSTSLSVTKEEDLRVFSFRSSQTIEDGNLVLNVSEYVGITNGSIDVIVRDNNSFEFEDQFQFRRDEERLTLGLDTLNSSGLLLLEELDIVVFEDSKATDSTTVQLRTLAGEPSFARQEETLVLRYPLIFSGLSYQLQGLDGIEEPLTPESDGQVKISLENVTFTPGKSSLTLDRNRNSVFQSAVQLPYDDDDIFELLLSKTDASLGVNGEQLTVSHPLLFKNETYTVRTTSDNEKWQPAEMTGSKGSLQLPSRLTESLLDDGTQIRVEDSQNRTVAELEPIPPYDDALFALLKNASDPPERNRESDPITVSHQLLFADETYTIRIETTNPDGTLSATVTGSDGSIELPSNANRTLFAESTQLQIFDSRDRTVVDTSLDPETVNSINVTLDGENGQLLNRSDNGFTAESTIWLRINGSVYVLDGEHVDDEGRLKLTGLDVDINENSTLSAIAFTNGGTEKVTFDVLSETDQSGSGSESSLQATNLLLVGAGLLILLLMIWLVVRAGIIPLGSTGTLVVDEVVVVFLSIYVFALLWRQVLTTDKAWFAVGAIIGFVIVSLASVIYARVLKSRVPTKMTTALVVGLVAGLGLTAVFAIFGQTVVEMLWPLAIGLGYGTGVAWLILRPIASTSSTGNTSRDTQPGPTQRRRPVQAEVSIIDSHTNTNSVVSSPVELSVQGNKRAVQSQTVEGGRTSVELMPGKWTFIVQSEGRQIAKQSQKVNRHNSTVRVAVKGQEITVRAQTSNDGVPNNATAVVEYGNGKRTTGRLDRGTYTASLPFDVQHAEVSVNHDFFKGESKQVDLRRTSEARIRLTPRQGTLAVSVTLGRDAVSDVPVTATRRDQPANTLSGRTDARGTVRFENVLIGQYDLSVELPVESRAFSVSPGSVSVTEGRSKDAGIQVRFNYSLSRDQRNRIGTLRERLDDIASSTRRDDAIQSYYTSVLQTVLDEIENIPHSGYAFLNYQRDPDTVVQAMLAATTEASDVVEDVLSSQRNVDLFSACSDLPARSPEWSGSVEIKDVLALANRDFGQQRAEIEEELAAVDEQITAELRELAEVSPAREMWEGIREMVQDQSGMGQTEAAASVFVALRLLTAIESLFDQPVLRKRLEQTVY